MTASPLGGIYTVYIKEGLVMVDRVIERTETEVPREPVVVHDDRGARSMNWGGVVAVIILVLLIIFFFGGRL